MNSAEIYMAEKGLKAGVRVYVDFLSESSTQFSGNRFSGNGVIDLVDGGYIYGRLDSGAPFMCMESDVKLIQDNAPQITGLF